MANIWGQDMRPMGSAGMAGGYSALSPAINSGVYFPQTRSVQSSLIPPNTQAPSLAGTPSLLSGMTGSQYQTPPMAGQPSGQFGAVNFDLNQLNNLPPWVDRGGWGGRSQQGQQQPPLAGQPYNQTQAPQPQMVPQTNQMSRFASYMQPQLAGQQRGTNQQASNPWWNQGRYNIGGYGGDMLQRRRPPQIGGGGVRRLDTGYGQPGGGFPWNTGGWYNQYQSPAMSGQNWNPGTANNALNNSLWQWLQQRGDPNQGWYDFANMNPGGSAATSAAY